MGIWGNSEEGADLERSTMIGRWMGRGGRGGPGRRRKKRGDEGQGKVFGWKGTGWMGNGEGEEEEEMFGCGTERKRKCLNGRVETGESKERWRWTG